jgi:GrpB-like predicted nucleotidyltransferase (UPF0157 family)
MTQPAPVVIVDYDPTWPAQFEELRATFACQLGDRALAIEHVGSTAVPGLAAKPILDIDIVIRVDESLPEIVALLEPLGYVHQGDRGISGREAFERVGGRDAGGESEIRYAHHLYVCREDNAELARHLAFRDYLRLHPVAARGYGDLKRELALRFGRDRAGYSAAKSEFVLAALKRAAEEDGRL